MDEIILRNGLHLPTLGLGAKIVSNSNEKAKQASYDILYYALETGKCNLFDTSESYGMQEQILGEALAATGKRDSVRLITKVGNKSQRTGNIRRALEASLRKLKTSYIDVYLFHWPQYGTFIQTYKEMEKFYEEGLVKSIGVCNCHRHHLEELMQNVNIPPMIHEFEIHPLFTQSALVNYCIAHDIHIIAYSPIARMHDVLIKAKPIRTIAARYGKTPVQIILQWHKQNNRIAIPSTANKRHFEEIYNAEKFSLSEKEIAWISSLDDNVRLRYNADMCDFEHL